MTLRLYLDPWLGEKAKEVILAAGSRNRRIAHTHEVEWALWRLSLVLTYSCAKKDEWILIADGRRFGKPHA